MTGIREAFNLGAMEPVPDAPPVSVEKLALLARYLRYRSADPTVLLPVRPEQVLTLDDWVRLNHRLAEELDDPDFGLGFGERFFGMPTLLGHLMSSCRTAGEALSAFLRFQELEHGAWHLSAHYHSDILELRYCPAHPLAWDRLVIDFAFASLCGVHFRLTGMTLQPVSAGFSYPRPSHTGHHRRLFGDELSFSLPTNFLRLPLAALELPVIGANETVRTVLESPLRTRLAEKASLLTMGRQVMALMDRQAAPLDFPAIARQLGTGPRRLQQLLQSEGTNFQTIRDEWRARQARRLLAVPHLSIKEITARLGFSESSAFTRAFRRWTGLAPAAWRQDNVPEPQG